MPKADLIEKTFSAKNEKKLTEALKKYIEENYDFDGKIDIKFSRSNGKVLCSIVQGKVFKDIMFKYELK